MAYTIKRSDGSVLVSIPDQAKEADSTSLILVGRGAINYGTEFAENFVHLAENFANLLPPQRPLIGQLWYDLNDDNLKIWNGLDWVLARGKTSSLNLPNSIVYRDVNGDFSAHIITADLNGNAATASKWKTARALDLTGDALGSVLIDGSRDVSMTVSVISAESAKKALIADRLTTARDISLLGDVTGTANFSGAANLRIDTAIAPSVGTSAASPGTLMRRGADGDVSAEEFIGALRGNAQSATKWITARKITLSGDVAGDVTFDGTANGTLATAIKSVPTTALANTGVTPGTYDLASVTVDVKGRITKISEGSVTTVINANYSNTSNISNTANSAKIANYANFAGSANTANYANFAGRWASPITLTLGDDLRGSVDFDGSRDVTLNAAIANTRVTPGVYPVANVRQFEVGSDGRIIAIANGSNQTEVDLSGFVKKSGDTMTGNLTAPGFLLDTNFFLKNTGSIPILKLDTNFSLTISSSNPVIQLDSDYRIYLNRTSNDLRFESNGATIGALFGNGTFSVKGDVVGFESFSDRRIKREIAPLTHSLDVIRSLNGYSYEKHKAITDEWIPEVGVIAQEVQTVVPTAVRDHDGMLTVKHEQIIAHLIEAVKVLEARVAELETKGR